jgi:FkbM family methyltransferase
VIVDPQTFFANTYVQGYYEPSVVRYLRYSVQTGMVCLDIGANVGFYSLLLANKVGASGKVIAFEPTAKIFEILQQNITQNNLKNVAAEQLALYNYDGFIQFHEGPPQFDVYNTIGQINHPDAMSQSFNANRIPCMRLDSYVASHKLNQIDLIKIDVEGAELFVLQGMEQMLAENPNLIILFEFTDHTTCGFDYSARDIINWLRAKGYQLFGINSKGRLVDLQLENSDFEKWQNHMLIASNMVNNINKPNI